MIPKNSREIPPEFRVQKPLPKKAEAQFATHIEPTSANDKKVIFTAEKKEAPQKSQGSAISPAIVALLLMDLLK